MHAPETFGLANVPLGLRDVTARRPVRSKVADLFSRAICASAEVIRAPARAILRENDRTARRDMSSMLTTELGGTP
jgi:hypothetical protein